MNWKSILVFIVALGITNMSTYAFTINSISSKTVIEHQEQVKPEITKCEKVNEPSLKHQKNSIVVGDERAY